MKKILLSIVMALCLVSAQFVSAETFMVSLNQVVSGELCNVVTITSDAGSRSFCLAANDIHGERQARRWVDRRLSDNYNFAFARALVLREQGSDAGEEIIQSLAEEGHGWSVTYVQQVAAERMLRILWSVLRSQQHHGLCSLAGGVKRAQ